VRDNLKTKPEVRTKVVAGALSYEEKRTNRDRPDWICRHGIKPGSSDLSPEIWQAHRHKVRTDFEKSIQQPSSDCDHGGTNEEGNPASFPRNRLPPVVGPKHYRKQREWTGGRFGGMYKNRKAQIKHSCAFPGSIREQVAIISLTKSKAIQQSP
jgi:hypothetical protein